jgi:hypothetical protein
VFAVAYYCFRGGPVEFSTKLPATNASCRAAAVQCVRCSSSSSSCRAFFCRRLLGASYCHHIIGTASRMGCLLVAPQQPAAGAGCLLGAAACSQAARDKELLRRDVARAEMAFFRMLTALKRVINDPLSDSSWLVQLLYSTKNKNSSPPSGGYNRTCRQSDQVLARGGSTNPPRLPIHTQG